MAEGEPGKDSEQNEKNGEVQNNLEEVIEEMSLDSNISIENLVEEASNEYEHLNKTLDEIDTWMTTLESRNDTLYTELQELLKSSKETRKELQQLHESDTNTSKNVKDQQGNS